jgi:hypothetical protein
MTRPDFRDRLLAALIEQIPAEKEASAPTLPTVRPRRPDRRRVMVAAVATAVVAIGGVVVVPLLSGPTGSTSAWAIERSETGDVLVTVHEVDDPVRLQDDLRAAGVPAVVRAGSPSCGTWSGEPRGELADVLRADVIERGGDHFWRIDPRALPPGHFLAFLITRTPVTSMPVVDGSDRDEPFVGATTYSTTIAATEDPPCAPLPSRPNSTTVAPSPT